MMTHVRCYWYDRKLILQEGLRPRIKNLEYYKSHPGTRDNNPSVGWEGRVRPYIHLFNFDYS